MSAKNCNIFCENVPENKIPSFWKDERRLDVLFAPFRDKRLNPVEWDSKYTDWKCLISIYTSHNKMLSFTLLDIEKAFTYNKRTPSCLKTVLEEMRKEGIVQHFDDYMRKSSDSWTGWMTDTLIKNPTLWLFTKVKGRMVNSTNTYVHVLTVQDEAKKVLLAITDDYIDKVMNTKQLLKILNEEKYSVDDLQLLLHYLNNQKKVALTMHMNDNKNESTLLIKFGNTPINEKEKNIYILENCERVLLEEIDKLEAKNKNFIIEAKQYLLKNNKNMAKICLKRKHENESRIAKKCDSLHNILTLLSSLQDAETNSIILDSYKKALDGLSKLNTNITTDEIDDVLIGIQEGLNNQEDMAKSLASSLVDLNSSDTELEEELAELMKEDSKESEQFEEDIKNLEDQMAKIKLPDQVPTKLIERCSPQMPP